MPATVRKPHACVFCAAHLRHPHRVKVHVTVPSRPVP